ncbi:MAG: type II secretion system protein N [Burkholderiales bacterium]|nr:type II secretion system protein N [Burkholderiales bacterium]
MNRISRLQYLLLALLIVLFLILRTPASIFGAIVSGATGGQIRLAAASGSLWRGSAQPLLYDHALGEQMQWAWQPRELLHGRLSYELHLDGGQANVAFGLHDLMLSQVNLNLAADPIFALDERSRTYGLTGQLHLSTDGFRLRNNMPDGTLTIDWHNAGSSLAPSVDPLGDYRLTATAGDKAWDLHLNTLTGRLVLNGNGKWSASEGLSTEISLRAAPGSEAALFPFLSRVGPGAPDAERRLPLRLS